MLERIPLEQHPPGVYAGGAADQRAFLDDVVIHVLRVPVDRRLDPGGGGEQRVTLRNDADRLHELRRCDVLEQEAARARSDRGVHVLV